MRELSLIWDVVTDDIRDNDFVQESKYVSGVHVERVFSEDEKQPRISVINMNWIPGGMTIMNFFLVLTLYILNAGQLEREQYIERSHRHGKICDQRCTGCSFTGETEIFFPEGCRA